MSQTVWAYPVELLEALARFGLAPRFETPPRFVRDQLSDLYRYEIRRLRGRLLAGEFPKADYIGHVIALRKTSTVDARKPHDNSGVLSTWAAIQSPATNKSAAVATPEIIAIWIDKTTWPAALR